jgi:hypothetical protein
MECDYTHLNHNLLMSKIIMTIKGMIIKGVYCNTTSIMINSMIHLGTYFYVNNFPIDTNESPLIFGMFTTLLFNTSLVYANYNANQH